MNWNELKNKRMIGSKKKIKPIVKFNNGSGAILCNKCRVIIKENLSKDEFFGKTDLLYCYNCALKIVNKIFNKQQDDTTTV